MKNHPVFQSRLVDPEKFVPDPDPALNFPSSGSGSKPCYFSTSKFRNYRKHLKFNHKEESISYLPFSISYYSPRSYSTQSPELKEKQLFYLSALSCFAGSESRQKFRIHANPDPQYLLVVWFRIKIILLPNFPFLL